MKKWLAVLFICLLFFVGYAYYPRPDLPAAEITKPSEKLQVSFLDVGQGDSIYIKTPDQTDVLIDGGPDNSVLTELGAVMDFWDHEINVMILTHPHADHIVGLIEVLKRYEIKAVYYTGVIYPSREYDIWLNLIDEKNIPLYVVTQPMNLTFSDQTELQFLYPLEDLTKKRHSEINNTSIVAKLVHGKTSMLFTGDAEIEVERELMAAGADIDADWLKLGHHGSKSSSSEEFLRAVSPDQAIILAGADNQFGHPHLITLERLKRLMIPAIRTDTIGTITWQSDGYIFTPK